MAGTVEATAELAVHGECEYYYLFIIEWVTTLPSGR